MNDWFWWCAALLCCMLSAVCMSSNLMPSSHRISPISDLLGVHTNHRKGRIGSEEAQQSARPQCLLLSRVCLASWQRRGKFKMRTWTRYLSVWAHYSYWRRKRSLSLMSSKSNPYPTCVPSSSCAQEQKARQHSMLFRNMDKHSQLLSVKEALEKDDVEGNRVIMFLKCFVCLLSVCVSSCQLHHFSRTLTH